MSDQQAGPARTLDRALLFLEERAGISFGESWPETRHAFDRTAKELGDVLQREFPAMRLREARAAARFIGFVSMGAAGTPWASDRERVISRVNALEAIRNLAARLAKGSPDAIAAEKWIAFYSGQAKRARDKAEDLRTRSAAKVEETERTPEQAGMIVTPAGDVVSREALERFLRSAGVAPALGEASPLPRRAPPPQK